MKKIVCVMSLIMGLVACSKEQNLNLGTDNATFIGDNQLSNDDCKDLIIDFYQKNRGSEITLKSNEVPEEIELDKTYEVQLTNLRDREVDKTYVAQYTVKKGNQSGYSLVVADKRFPMVLVYVPNGNFSDTVEIEPLKAYMRTIPSTLETLYGKYEEDGELVNYRLNSVVTSNRLATEWHDMAPYNSEIPLTCNSLNASAGSHTVAVAQILAQLKRGSYNWTSLLGSSTVSVGEGWRSTEVARLFKDVATATKTDYICHEESRALVSDVVAGCKSLGLPSAYSVAAKDYSTTVNLIVQELKKKKSVIMQGTEYINNRKYSGHYWVVDEAAVSIDGWMTQLHCNWGEAGGKSNGVFTYLTNNCLLTGTTGIGIPAPTDKNSFRNITIIAGLY